MIDFSLEKEQIELREKVRDFADTYMKPEARKYDTLAEFPWPIVKKAYEEHTTIYAKLYNIYDEDNYDVALWIKN